MDVEARKQHLATTLLASAARTAATGNGDSVRLPDAPNDIAVTLDVTAAATEAGDILEVYVQTKLDGSNWVDVVRFTDVLGNGGAKRFVALLSEGTMSAAVLDVSSQSLSAGDVLPLIGDEWRVRWAITDASTDNASFTFSVTAQVM